MADKEHEVSTPVKVSVFVGIFLLRILDTIPWLWGNLTVYVTSYYYAKGHHSSVVNTNWGMSGNILGYNIGMLVGNSVARRIGHETTIFLSILAFNVSILVSGVALAHSIILFSIIFGLATGIIGGIIESCQLTIIVDWTRRYHGLAVSAVTTSNVLGSVATNLLLTFYINPENKKPDSIQNRMRVFTQPDVVGNVPNAFVLLGCLSAVFSFCGFLLIRVRPGDKSTIQRIYTQITRFSSNVKEKLPLVASTSHRVQGETVYTDRLEENNGVERDMSSRSLAEQQETATQESRNLDHSNSSQSSYRSIPAETETDRNVIQGNDIEDNRSRSSNPKDFTPLQALKVREFYALWLFIATQNYGFFIINTYLKAFGLLYIPDDHFLTAVVLVKCLCTPFFTWLSGFWMDKVGVKMVTVLLTGIFCIVSSFFDVTAVNRWLYLVACVAYGCSLFSQYCLTSACCVKLFGRSHFTTILGLASTSTYILLPSLPVLTSWIIKDYGWFTLFSSVGCLEFVSLVALVWGLPETTRF